MKWAFLALYLIKWEETHGEACVPPWVRRQSHLNVSGCLVEVTRENERCLERRLGDAKRKKKRKEANEGKE